MDNGSSGRLVNHEEGRGRGRRRRQRRRKSLTPPRTAAGSSRGGVSASGPAAAASARSLPVPRFRVGARVECCIDDAFLKGTVVGHHYRESAWEPGVFAPYQVKLDGQSPGSDLIFVPRDDDSFIRAADALAETLK